ncbi:MAG: HAD family hydrolase [Candidatus Nanohaloarchaea archaeon]
MEQRPLIFDLDNTLVTNSDEVYRSFNAALRYFGVDEVPPERYDSIDFWSLDSEGKNTALDRLGVERSPEEFRDVFDWLYTAKTEHYILEGRIRVLPGVRNFLSRVRGTSPYLGIVTNSPHETAHLKLSMLGLDRFFDRVVTPREVPRKPDPSGLEKLVEESGLRGDEFLYVGDSRKDLVAARRAGLEPLMVSDQDMDVPRQFRSFRELERSFRG